MVGNEEILGVRGVAMLRRRLQLVFTKPSPVWGQPVVLRVDYADFKRLRVRAGG